MSTFSTLKNFKYTPSVLEPVTKSVLLGSDLQSLSQNTDHQRDNERSVKTSYSSNAKEMEVKHSTSPHGNELIVKTLDEVKEMEVEYPTDPTNTDTSVLHTAVDLMSQLAHGEEEDENVKAAEDSYMIGESYSDIISDTVSVPGQVEACYSDISDDDTRGGSNGGRRRQEWFCPSRAEVSIYSSPFSFIEIDAHDCCVTWF